MKHCQTLLTGITECECSYVIDKLDELLPRVDILSTEEFVRYEKAFDRLGLGSSEYVLLAVVSAVLVILEQVRWCQLNEVVTTCEVKKGE